MAPIHQPLRVGLIGLGRQGQKHARALASLEKAGLVTVVGCCDLTQSAASKWQKWPFYQDFQSLLSEQQPEVVILATANTAHFEMAKTILQKGIHLIKEKPLALSWAEATQLKALAEQHEVQLRVCQQRLFNPAFQEFKRLVPLFVSLSRDTNKGKVSYQLTLNDQHESWYWDQAAGGGVWLNLVWHQVYMLQWLFGPAELLEVQHRSGGKRTWLYDADHASLAELSMKLADKRAITATLFASSVVSPAEELSLTTGRHWLKLRKNTAGQYVLRLDGHRLVLPAISSHQQYVRQLSEYLLQIKLGWDPGTDLELQTQKILSSPEQKGKNEDVSHSRPAWGN